MLNFNDKDRHGMHLVNATSSRNVLEDLAGKFDGQALD